MALHYSISFEEIELIRGLGDDKPVWLYMKASVFADADPSTPLWTAEVGSLPPDANRPIDGFPVGENGRFADHLVTGQSVRNDDPVTGKPRFTLPFLPIEEDGQYVELIVWMLPKVWLEKKRVKVSEFDRRARDAFLSFWVGGAFGGVIGGAIGAAVGSFLGGLFGDDEQTVEVPCFQSVIMARHIFRQADLAAMWTGGPAQHGPTDNDSSAVCDNIDSFYFLSASMPEVPLFPQSPPLEKSPCVLAPRAYTPRDDQLVARWGDVGDNYRDHVQVSVMIEDDLAEVRIWEQHAGGDFTASWHRCAIDRDDPLPPFRRNVYDDALIPAASVTPHCPTCSKFSNLTSPFIVPVELLWAGMLPGTHVGTRPTFPMRFDSDVPASGPRCACPAAAGDDSDARPVREFRAVTEPFGVGHLAQLRADRQVALWSPAQEYPVLSGGGAARNFTVINHEFPWPAELDVSWVVRGQPEGSFVASYAEVKDRRKCVGRLRYLRVGDDGTPVVDVMLTQLPPVIH